MFHEIAFQYLIDIHIFDKVYEFLTLCVHLIVTLATLGIPYWYYYTYRHHHPSEPSSEDGSIEEWPTLIEKMGASWEIYSFLAAAVFPLMFPMLSVSGLPMCSTASFVATMTLFTGVVCLSTSTFFKVFVIKALRKDRIRGYWICASPLCWFQVPDRGFWLFLSLPTIWFVLSFGLLVTTILLSVWERLDPVSENLNQLGCTVEKLFFFKWVLLGFCFASLLQLVFVFLKQRLISP